MALEPSSTPSLVVSTSSSNTNVPTVPVYITDAHRDPVDWTMIIVGMLSTVVSVIAIVVALKANRNATGAEMRSRAAAAAERKRVFELEILRDLIQTLDDNANNVSFWHDVGNDPAKSLTATLMNLPADGMRTWRFVASRPSREDLIRKFDPNGEISRVLGDGELIVRASDLTSRIFDVLLSEIEAAISIRMNE